MRLSSAKLNKKFENHICYAYIKPNKESPIFLFLINEEKVSVDLKNGYDEMEQPSSSDWAILH